MRYLRGSGLYKPLTVACSFGLHTADTQAINLNDFVHS